MKEDFLYTIALMGVADYIYKGRKEKWIYKWMTKEEIEIYNIGWKYAKDSV